MKKRKATKKDFEELLDAIWEEVNNENSEKYPLTNLASSIKEYEEMWELEDGDITLFKDGFREGLYHIAGVFYEFYPEDEYYEDQVDEDIRRSEWANPDVGHRG